jgi:predicted dehydrogenase
MAVSNSEATSMILASERANKLLEVISQRRWYPSTMRIKEAIDSGKLGKPALASVTILGWRDEAYYLSDPWRGKWETEGGGVCINQAPHQFDLLCWFLGPIARIKAEWENINHPYIEVEDSAVATVRFTTGAIASILVSNSQKPGLYAKVHVHGSSGASVGVQTDGGAMFIAGQSNIVEPPYNDLWNIEEEQQLLETFKEQDFSFFKTIDPTTYFFTLQIEDFVKAIVERSQPLVTGRDGREVVRLIEGIYLSGRSHSTVTFHDETDKR